MSYRFCRPRYPSDGRKGFCSVVLRSLLPSDQRERSPLFPLVLRSTLPSDQRERSPISLLSLQRSPLFHLALKMVRPWLFRCLTGDGWN